MRIDANISVHRAGQPFGVRSEIKNIGSIRGVSKAVDFEINRQCEILDTGRCVINETRMWDPVSEQTLPMRDKEEKQVKINLYLWLCSNTGNIHEHI